MKVHVGIDPGKQGAFGIITSKRFDKPECVSTYKMPLIKARKGKAEYDLQQIKKLLLQFCSLGAFVTIEAITGFPRRAGHVVSVGAQYYGIGLMVGLVEGLGLPYQTVTPQKWTKAMLVGVPGTDPKMKSMLIAPRMFPHADLRKPRGSLDENKCDAVLIAEYGRRTVDEKNGAE